MPLWSFSVSLNEHSSGSKVCESYYTFTLCCLCVCVCAWLCECVGACLCLSCKPTIRALTHIHAQTHKWSPVDGQSWNAGSWGPAARIVLFSVSTGFVFLFDTQLLPSKIQWIEDLSLYMERIVEKRDTTMPLNTTVVTAVGCRLSLMTGKLYQWR